MTEVEAKKKVLDLARSEIGYHEEGSNGTKYASAYDFDTKLYGFDMNGSPWCDYFVDWLFCKCFGYDTGSAMTYQFSGCSGAACASSASYYQSHGAWYTEPEEGDQIFFYVSGGINHTGIVEKIEGEYVTTIEGNSSDQVKRNQYKLGHSTIAGYGRPMWKAVSSIEVTEDNAETVSDAQEEITPTTIPIAQNELQYGSVGDAVKILQAMLNYFGADLDVDGEFGIKTYRALWEWQGTKDILADGICGTETWKELMKNE